MELRKARKDEQILKRRNVSPFPQELLNSPEQQKRQQVPNSLSYIYAVAKVNSSEMLTHSFGCLTFLTDFLPVIVCIKKKLYL